MGNIKLGHLVSFLHPDEGRWTAYRQACYPRAAFLFESEREDKAHFYARSGCSSLMQSKMAWSKSSWGMYTILLGVLAGTPLM